MKFLLATLFYATFCVVKTDAFSSGAGSCDTGGAVQGLHLTNPVTGTLDAGSFQISIGDTPLVTTFGNQVTIGESFAISITPTTSRTFRGALIRVAGTALSTVSLAPNTNSQVATACDGSTAIGITHTEKSDKTELGGTISIAEAGDYIVDVTVVVSNSGSSEYYYTQYMVVAADASTTAVPAAAPVAAGPVATEAPVGDTSTTQAPAYGEITDSPVGAPTKDNTDGMGQNETSAPGSAPTMNETTPVSPPASMRVPTPVAAPTSSSSFVAAMSSSISAATLIIASMLFL